jgi:2-hydroxychromene-2-carboxylate isomerase
MSRVTGRRFDSGPPVVSNPPMSLKNRLKGLAIDALLSEPVRRARTGAHEVGRRLRREEPRVELYYQVDDPYSHLLVQLVPRLAELYPELTWEFYLVAEPSPDVDPEPVLRRKNAARDARELARYHDLEFPEVRKPPEGTPIARAAAVLTFRRPFPEQLAAARDVGEALWAGDGKAMALARGRHRYEATGNIKPLAHANYARLRKRGHYHGGVLRYGGEWYWGPDRLPYLEDRLRGDFERPDAPSVLQLRPAEQRPAEALPVEDGRVPLGFFFSFRSPYSYLALDRVLALAERYPVRLDFRPVRPMVARGLQVPRTKQLYIVHDAKREAERLGIPFGRICDPLGAGVDNCLAIFSYAEAQGRPGEFLRAAMRGAWAEGLDLADDDDLRQVVDRAGLDWDGARAALSDHAWKQRADDNAIALNKLDLWGVPSFQLGEYAAWGQDRLFIIEDKLRAHAASAPE